MDHGKRHAAEPIDMKPGEQHHGNADLHGPWEATRGNASCTNRGKRHAATPVDMDRGKRHAAQPIDMTPGEQHHGNAGLHGPREATRGRADRCEPWEQHHGNAS